MTMTESSSQSSSSLLGPSIHPVTLPDGSVRYRLRSLRSSADDDAGGGGEGGPSGGGDVDRWAAFCASVFAYKPDPPPASYFARHLRNDPRGDPGLVRVLVYLLENDCDGGEGEIASSVRVFRRTLSVPPGGREGGVAKIEAGGIGEVCTSPDHRRRGLSKILLTDAVNVMKSLRSEGMTCSLLHASPAFRPVYAKFGYESVKSEWSVVPVRLKGLSNRREAGEWRVRPARFPGDASYLERLHRTYSEERLITVVRSSRYWEEYVSAELGDTLWVLTKSAEGPDDGGAIAAWISIRKKAGRFQLREFGVDKRSERSIGTSQAMRYLLGVAMDQAGEAPSSDSEASLLLPTFVLSEMRTEVADGEGGVEDATTFLDLSSAEEENDEGWMYLDLGDSRTNVRDLTTRATDPVPHLIWPTDSF
ncbi:hypothetical protein ACHAWF_011842 [Thalassiosira exigua]